MWSTHVPVTGEAAAAASAWRQAAVRAEGAARAERQSAWWAETVRPGRLAADPLPPVLLPLLALHRTPLV